MAAWLHRAEMGVTLGFPSAYLCQFSQLFVGDHRFPSAAMRPPVGGRLPAARNGMLVEISQTRTRLGHIGPISGSSLVSTNRRKYKIVT